MVNNEHACHLILTKGLDELSFITEQLNNFFNEQKSLVNPVNLLIEELYSNSIYYGKAKSLKVDIYLYSTPSILKITYMDNGIPFNPLIDVQKPDLHETLENREIGGLGIHFIKKMTDNQIYKRTKTQNQLILEKKLEN